MKSKVKEEKKQIVWRVVALVFGVLVFSILISYLLSTYGLMTSHYKVPSDKLNGSFRVVSLADLHGHIFGKENRRLIRRVKKEAPDLIIICGDLVDKNDPDSASGEALIRELVKIAPVYLSRGNHETEYDSQHSVEGESVLQRFREAGAHVLNYAYEDILVKGQQIRIGGLYGYAMPEVYAKSWEEAEVPFLKDFQNTDRFSMLMCHIPLSFLAVHGLDSWKFDTVLSGHVHGGQIRFPFFSLLTRSERWKDDDTFPYWGGLWAPDQGRFPGRLSGVYKSNDGKRTMVLSRGLGNTDWVPRINNIPEVQVIDYCGE